MIKRIYTLALLLVFTACASMVWAQKVQIGNVFYRLAADQTAGVTYASRDSAANYAGVTRLVVPAVVTYQGVRYTVTHLEPYAFANSAALQAVSLPASLTEIGEAAFASCPALTTVNLPTNLSSIGQEAFYACSALTNIRIPNGITTIEQRLFAECTSLRSVILPAQLTQIRPFAFADCSQLASISLPSTLTTIERSAFANCAALTTIVVPNSVLYIGAGAFSGCTGLSNVRLSNNLIDVGEGVFEGCTGLTRPIYSATLFIYMPASFRGSYTIPNGIEVILEGAFAGCTGLTNIKIPASVWYIDDEAFADCTGLPVFEGIRYADTYLVQVVDQYMSTYTVRPGTRWIAEEAFAWLNEMNTVILPASLSSIGEEAFLQCKNLSAIYNYAFTPQELTDDVFGGQYEWKDYESYGPVDKSTCVLYVPAESVDLYRKAEVWKEFAHILPINAPQGIDQTADSPSSCRKYLQDGQVLIQRGDDIYTLTGIKINQ